MTHGTRGSDVRRLSLIAAMCALTGCGAGPRDAVDDEPMRVVPIDEAVYVPIDAQRPEGPQVAVLWGDPAEGPSAMLLEIERGEGPPHSHSSDYHLVLLDGEMKHWAAGEPEADAAVLKPGSYWFQPGGQAHIDACLTDECTMFIKWSDRRDAMLADDSDD